MSTKARKAVNKAMRERRQAVKARPCGWARQSPDLERELFGGNCTLSNVEKARLRRIEGGVDIVYFPTPMREAVQP
jgi:hypothetical protein